MDVFECFERLGSIAESRPGNCAKNSVRICPVMAEKALWIPMLTLSRWPRRTGRSAPGRLGLATARDLALSRSTTWTTGHTVLDMEPLNG